MPKKICNYSGCHAIIAGNKKYCKLHEKMKGEVKALKNKRYDKKIRHKRDKQYTELYHSIEWRVLRNSVLSKYKGLDLFALFIDKEIRYANIGHHIIELKDNWNLRLAFDNIFPVDDASHKKIHAMYKKDKEGTQDLLNNILEKWRKKYGV